MMTDKEAANLILRNTVPSQQLLRPPNLPPLQLLLGRLPLSQVGVHPGLHLRVLGDYASQQVFAHLKFSRVSGCQLNRRLRNPSSLLENPMDFSMNFL